MPEEKKSWLRSILSTYIGDILSYYANLAKRKIRKYATSIIVTIASLTIIIYGIGSLLGSFFPEWRAGTSHILIGIIFILIVWIYGRYD